jgi:plastocyanin
MRYTMCSFMVAVLLLFAFSASGQETKSEGKPEAKQELKVEGSPAGEAVQHEHTMGKENRVVASVDVDGVQRVELTGGEYFFDPNYIVVKVNKPVEMKVKKTGGFTPHDIVVKAPDAGINFSESMDKDPKVIKFTPTKVGKYEMYCSKKLPFVKSHKDRGMDGFIEVVE